MPVQTIGKPFELPDGSCQTDSNWSQFPTNRRNLGDAKLPDMPQIKRKML